MGNYIDWYDKGGISFGFLNGYPHFFTVSENRYPNEPLMECVSENPEHLIQHVHKLY